MTGLRAVCTRLLLGLLGGLGCLAWSADAPALIGLAIGINDYAHGSSLKRARQDAAAVADALIKAKLTTDDHFLVMTDEQDGTPQFPGKGNLRKALARFDAQRGSGKSVLLMFLSGKLILAEGQVGLLPADGAAETLAGLLPLSVLQDRLRAAPAAAKLLILDLAHAEAPATAAAEAMLVATFRDEPYWIVTSAGPGETGMVDADSGTGLLASVLKDGLDGGADFGAEGNHDGSVSVKELAYFLVRATIARAAEKGRKQHPAVLGKAGADAQLATYAPFPALVDSDAVLARCRAAPAGVEFRAEMETLTRARADTEQQLASGSVRAAAACRNLAAKAKEIATQLTAALAARDVQTDLADAANRATTAKAADAAADLFAAAFGLADRVPALLASRNHAEALAVGQEACRKYDAATVRALQRSVASGFQGFTGEDLASVGEPLQQDIAAALERADAAMQGTAAAKDAVVAAVQACQRLKDAKAAVLTRVMGLAGKLAQQGNAGAALTWLDKALTADPTHAAARTLRRQLRANHGFRAGELFSNKAGLRFAYVPAGEFNMGSPATEPGRKADEAQHPVRISHGFFFGITEVSQAEWTRVMGKDYRPVQGVHPESQEPGFIGDTLPKLSIAWDQAVLFCQFLRKGDGYCYRLPTEAEWEYACRAGTTTPFNTGNAALTALDAAFYVPGGSALRGPKPVGTSGPANAWGLFDMHGNVSEWCSDWYAPYPAVAVTDPAGPGTLPDSDAEVAKRTLRGGSWYDALNHLRSAKRASYLPAASTKFIGFRVVLEAGDLPR